MHVCESSDDMVVQRIALLYLKFYQRQKLGDFFSMQHTCISQLYTVLLKYLLSRGTLNPEGMGLNKQFKQIVIYAVRYTLKYIGASWV